MKTNRDVFYSKAVLWTDTFGPVEQQVRWTSCEYWHKSVKCPGCPDFKELQNETCDRNQTLAWSFGTEHAIDQWIEIIWTQSWTSFIFQNEVAQKCINLRGIKRRASRGWLKLIWCAGNCIDLMNFDKFQFWSFSKFDRFSWFVYILWYYLVFVYLSNNYCLVLLLHLQHAWYLDSDIW